MKDATGKNLVPDRKRRVRDKHAGVSVAGDEVKVMTDKTPLTVEEIERLWMELRSPNVTWERREAITHLLDPLLAAARASVDQARGEREKVARWLERRAELTSSSPGANSLRSAAKDLLPPFPTPIGDAQDPFRCPHCGAVAVCRITHADDCEGTKQFVDRGDAHEREEWEEELESGVLLTKTGKNLVPDRKKKRYFRWGADFRLRGLERLLARQFLNRKARRALDKATRKHP